MPRIELNVKFTVEEFIACLPKEMQELYDSLVKGLISFGIEEKIAKETVAYEFYNYIKNYDFPEKEKS